MGGMHSAGDTNTASGGGAIGTFSRPPFRLCRELTSGRSAMPGPPLQSLVKYDTPSLLTTKDKKSAKPGKGGKKLPPVEGVIRSAHGYSHAHVP